MTSEPRPSLFVRMDQTFMRRLPGPRLLGDPPKLWRTILLFAAVLVPLSVVSTIQFGWTWSRLIPFLSGATGLTVGHLANQRRQMNSNGGGLVPLLPLVVTAIVFIVAVIRQSLVWTLLMPVAGLSTAIALEWYFRRRNTAP